MLTTLIGQTLDGKYYLDKLLGQGGMGAVFLATHLGTKRPVALKVIAPQFMANEEVGERFRREAEAAGRLRHPNVVNVTDFGVTTVDNNQIAYLVMEYLDGNSLGDLLKKEGRLPLPFIVDIVEQICLAIGNAHKSGIIHRDLKPDNIWLQPDGRGGYLIKVLDFGLAKLRDASVDEDASHPDQTSPLATHIQTGSNNTVRAGAVTQAQFTDDAETQIQLAPSPIEAPTLMQPAVHIETDAATLIQSPAQPTEIEAATLIQPVASTEERTRLYETEEDQVTQIQIPAQPPDDEDATHIQPAVIPDNSTATKSRAASQYSTNSSASNASGATNSLSTHSSSTVELTTFGSILGTPLYMSPEQCRGEMLDARSDIYSLGVIVYQMLAGEPPFRGTMMELMDKHCEAPPPELKEKRADIPDSLGKLVMSTLAKKADQRPATAEIFATALRATAEGEEEILRQSKSYIYSSQGAFFALSTPLYGAFAVLTLSLSFALSARLSANAYLTAAFYLFMFVMMLLATRLNTAMNTLLVQELRINPMSRVHKKALWKIFFSHLPALLATLVRGFIQALSGFLQLVLPGLRRQIDSTLVPSVVVIEQIRGQAALARSKTLVMPLRSVARSFLARDFGIILLALIAISCSMIFTTLIFGGNRRDAFSVMLIPAIRHMIVVYCWFLLITVHGVYAATPMALLYFKAKQASGERVNETTTKDWQGGKKKHPDKMGKATVAWLLIPLLMLGLMIGLSLFNFNSSEEDSLSDAVRKGRRENVRQRLAKGASANEKGFRNTSLLMTAASGGYAELIKDLLAAGARIDTKDNEGDTALVYAANANRLEALQTLIQAGADLNAKNNQGETALMGAVVRGRVEIVEALIAAQADVGIKNNKGKTALRYAEEEGRKEIAEMLKAAGATE
jgi:serine/threonine protein kinase